MTNNITSLLSYVNSVLHNKDNLLKIEDEKAFYYASRENGLTGIVFHKIKKAEVSKTLFHKLEHDFLAYIQRDLVQQSTILKIKAIFNEVKIDYIFLKGSHLKQIYPSSHMRAMGDIDVLIRPKALNKVHEVFNKHNIKLVSRSVAHDVFITKDNVNIEIHPGFQFVKDEKYSEFLKDAWQYAQRKSEFEYEFSRSFELVYLTYHLVKHMHSGGIGLRSVLDIAVFINYYERELDITLLNKLLVNSKLETFFSYLIAINNELFAYNILLRKLNVIKIDNIVKTNLINHITTSGVHGVGSNHNEFTSRLIANNKKQSKIKFLLSRVFPSPKEMKGIYPVLNKFWILLPIFWVVRFFKVVFIRGRTNFRKLKRVKKANNKEAIDDLFKKIGI